jgi:hypothetical protein
LVLTLPCAAPSQASGATAGASAKQPSQRVVYRQFFKHVMFLEHQADLADKSGKDGSPLRNFHQNRARLTASETALMKQVAQDNINAVDAVDGEISAEIKKFRDQYPGGKLAPNTPLPQPPAKLHDLQTQRDNIILAHLATLQAGFGSARFQALDAYVQNEFTPHIKVDKVDPGRPKSMPTNVKPFPTQP